MNPCFCHKIVGQWITNVDKIVCLGYSVVSLRLLCLFNFYNQINLDQENCNSSAAIIH